MKGSTTVRGGPGAGFDAEPSAPKISRRRPATRSAPSLWPATTCATGPSRRHRGHTGREALEILKPTAWRRAGAFHLGPAGEPEIPVARFVARQKLQEGRHLAPGRLRLDIGLQTHREPQDGSGPAQRAAVRERHEGVRAVKVRTDRSQAQSTI
jgi:hypothetical protein